MRVLSLIVLGACAPGDPPEKTPVEDTAWLPEEAWEGVDVPTPRVIMEGLSDPQALAVGGGKLWVVEPGEGRVWTYEDGVSEVAIDGLQAPGRIAADEQGAVLIEGDSIILIDEGDDPVTVAEGLFVPVAVGLDHQSIWWVDEGTGADGVVGRAARDGTAAETVASGLESPRGLALSGEAAFVAEIGEWRVIKVVPGQSPVEVVSPSGTISDVAADCEGVFWLTESSRWPYPGFVSTVDGSDEQRIAESPPEPDRLILAGTHVLWSTKQSIHSIPRQGGTFTTVAQRTAVGDLVVWGQSLIWSDPERGMVLAVGL